MNMIPFTTFDTQEAAVAAGQVWLAANITTTLLPVTQHLVLIDQDAIQHLELPEIRRIKGRAMAAARRAK